MTGYPPAGGSGADLPVPEPEFGRTPRPAAGLRWALSMLSFEAHAVDEHGDHPFAVFVALCGHRLLMSGLYDVPPGPPCAECGDAVVQRRANGGPMRWARSPGDVRWHAVANQEVVHVAGAGWMRTLCGTALPEEDLDVATQPSPPLCSGCVTAALAIAGEARP